MGRYISFFIISCALLICTAQAQYTISPKDSLVSGTDTTAVINLYGQADELYVFVKDDGDTRTDSLYFWVQDSVGIGWSRVSGWNLLTGNKDQVVVPGKGNTQIYLVFCFGIYSFKISRENKLYTAGEQTYFNVIAKKWR